MTASKQKLSSWIGSVPPATCLDMHQCHLCRVLGINITCVACLDTHQYRIVVLGYASVPRRVLGYASVPRRRAWIRISTASSCLDTHQYRVVVLGYASVPRRRAWIRISTASSCLGEVSTVTR